MLFRKRATRLSAQQPGLRFWWSDAVVMVLCALATWLLWPPLGGFSLVLPVTLAHFFLFCNVFRIRRTYELVWAVIYLVNILYWVFLREFSWLGVLALQTPVTLAFIAFEVGSPRYHGVFWERWSARRTGPPMSGDIPKM